VMAEAADYDVGSLATSFYSSWLALRHPRTSKLLLGSTTKNFKATWNIRQSQLENGGNSRLVGFLSFYTLNSITEAPMVEEEAYLTNNSMSFALRLTVEFDDFYILQAEARLIAGVDAAIVIILSIIGLYHFAHFGAEVGIAIKKVVQKKCCRKKYKQQIEEDFSKDMQELLGEEHDSS